MKRSAVFRREFLFVLFLCLFYVLLPLAWSSRVVVFYGCRSCFSPVFSCSFILSRFSVYSCGVLEFSFCSAFVLGFLLYRSYIISLFDCFRFMCVVRVLFRFFALILFLCRSFILLSFFFFFHVSFFCRSRVLTSPFRSLAVLLVVPPSRSTHRRPRFAPDFGQGDRENKQLLLACSRAARCCGHHREFVLVLGEKIHISAHGPMYVLGWRGEGGGEESERKGEKEGGRGIE